MKVIEYVIADDHKIFRQGLKLTLGTDPSLKCAGEAGNGVELLALLEIRQPDVVLLDIKMPDMDGIEALGRIRSQYPDLRVLILTMYEEEHFIIHLMETGANGYLLKNAEPDEISMAIHTVWESEYYFSDLVSATLLRKVMMKKRAPVVTMPQVKLTERETEVLKLICQELTAAEIGDMINLSARTVEGIRASLIEKTGTRNAAGLVLYAIRNRIVS